MPRVSAQFKFEDEDAELAEPSTLSEPSGLSESSDLSESSERLSPRRRRRLSITIERRNTQTIVSFDVARLLRLLTLLLCVGAATGLVITPIGGHGATMRAAVSPHRAALNAAAATRSLGDLHGLGSPLEDLKMAVRSPGAIAMVEALRAAPLRARLGLVNACILAEHRLAFLATRRLEGASGGGRRQTLPKELRGLMGVISEGACSLAFPATFASVRTWHRRRSERAEVELERAAAELRVLLAASHPTARFEVAARVKSLTSVFEKVFVRGKGVDDLLALRVIVEPAGSDPAGCATHCRDVADVVSSVWASAGPEKDYISRPKRNGYQSLHLEVTLPSGAPLEVQIRTRCMHEDAEHGGASHALYKLRAAVRRAKMV